MSAQVSEYTMFTCAPEGLAPVVGAACPTRQSRLFLLASLTRHTRARGAARTWKEVKRPPALAPPHPSLIGQHWPHGSVCVRGCWRRYLLAVLVHPQTAERPERGRELDLRVHARVTESWLSRPTAERLAHVVGGSR